MIGCKDLVGELLKEVPYPLGSPVICFFTSNNFTLSLQWLYILGFFNVMLTTSAWVRPEGPWNSQWANYSYQNVTKFLSFRESLTQYIDKKYFYQVTNCQLVSLGENRITKC